MTTQIGWAGNIVCLVGNIGKRVTTGNTGSWRSLDEKGDDQDDIPDLESIPSDDEEQVPIHPDCKLTNFDCVQPSAIYEMDCTNALYFVMTLSAL